MYTLQPDYVLVCEECGYKTVLYGPMGSIDTLTAFCAHCGARIFLDVAKIRNGGYMSKEQSEE